MSKLKLTENLFRSLHGKQYFIEKMFPAKNLLVLVETFFWIHGSVCISWSEAAAERSNVSPHHMSPCGRVPWIFCSARSNLAAVHHREKPTKSGRLAGRSCVPSFYQNKRFLAVKQREALLFLSALPVVLVWQQDGDFYFGFSAGGQIS